MISISLWKSLSFCPSALNFHPLTTLHTDDIGHMTSDTCHYGGHKTPDTRPSRFSRATIKKSRGWGYQIVFRDMCVCGGGGRGNRLSATIIYLTCTAMSCSYHLLIKVCALLMFLHYNNNLNFLLGGGGGGGGWDILIQCSCTTCSQYHKSIVLPIIIHAVTVLNFIGGGAWYPQVPPPPSTLVLTSLSIL